MDRAVLPEGWALRPLIEIAQINPSLDRRALDDRTLVTFVPMRAVAVEGGGIVNPETRPYGEVKKGYTGFLSGDIIMAKITPCMENGKIAVVPDVPGQVCFGSTEFHVIRPEKDISSKWIERFLLQYEIRSKAKQQMAGGVGQLRVPATFLKSLRIPIAPVAEQAHIANTLDELLFDLDTSAAALERAQSKIGLYRASVLKAAIGGTLTEDWRAGHRNAEPVDELLKRIAAEREARARDAAAARRRTGPRRKRERAAAR